MIPKIIHYCWFGGKDKPKLIRECIESWGKYCSDYTIIEWNEDNFDIACCDYVKDAYAAKKWSFVSDYARHYVLYNFGGIYLDTDVKLLKPLDSLLKSNFLGMETDKCDLNTGLICGCVASSWYCEQALSVLNKIKPILENGDINRYIMPVITTEIFEKLGYVRENKLQYIADFTIYPTEYFAHNTVKSNKGISPNTYSIHYYTASWLTKSQKLKKKVQSLLGAKITGAIVKLKKKLKGNINNKT